MSDIPIIKSKSHTINCNGRLMDLNCPVVMGILNITPDSFFPESRKQTEIEIVERVDQIVREGAKIIDIGACSTRPGGEIVNEEEELKRLSYGLSILRREQPEVVVSVDTFRPSVAHMAVEEYGASIINDVSGGEDPELLGEVVRLGVPYILMSLQSSMEKILMGFAEKIQILRDMGVKDVILDPGFGFGKTIIDGNFDVLSKLEKLYVFDLPILVGVSRKRMIFNLLGSDPSKVLNGTTVVNTIALMKGASILRVHDVKEAVEACKIVNEIM